MTTLELLGTLSMGIVLTVIWLRIEAGRFLLGGSLTLRPGVVPTVKDESKARELQAVGEARADFARKAQAGAAASGLSTTEQGAYDGARAAGFTHAEAGRVARMQHGAKTVQVDDD